MRSRLLKYLENSTRSSDLKLNIQNTNQFLRFMSSQSFKFLQGIATIHIISGICYLVQYQNLNDVCITEIRQKRKFKQTIFSHCWSKGDTFGTPGRSHIFAHFSHRPTQLITVKGHPSISLGCCLVGTWCVANSFAFLTTMTIFNDISSN